MFRGALFLRDELPIRLAHRVVELENLPFGLSTVTNILNVKQWYIDSFNEITQFTVPKLLRHYANGQPQIDADGRQGKRDDYWSPEKSHREKIEDEQVEETPSHHTDLAPEVLLERFNNDFCEMLIRVKRRHDNVVQTVGTL